MSIFQVSTTAQLYSALSSARAGDEIKLASGTYSGVSLSGLNFSGAVSISSADATKPAVFTDLQIAQSSNLSFSNIAMTGVDSATSVFLVNKSSAISFDHVEISGPKLTDASSQFGLWIRDSSSVTVTNSEFHDLGNGAFVLNSTGVTIADSYFHDLRSDGIQSSASSNLAFNDNFFTDFHPATGDHPDAIQIFTSNKTVADHDITISGNLITRGEGGISQGIFVTDEVGVPMVNVNISDNMVLGGMYNSIMIAGVASGSITNNTVAGLPDMDSWIRTVSSPTVTVTGNSATAYIVGSSSDTPPGNTAIGYPSDGGTAVLTAWLASHEMPGYFDSTTTFLTDLGLSTSTLVYDATPTNTVDAPSLVALAPIDTLSLIHI